MNIRCLNLFQIVVQYLSHRRTCHISSLLRQTTVSQITTRMLGVSHIHIRNNIYNTTVCLLRKALILATVSGFHMKNWNMQSLCTNYGQAGIGITKNQYCIRLNLSHQFVTLCNDISTGFTKIRSNCIQINLRILQF